MSIRKFFYQCVNPNFGLYSTECPSEVDKGRWGGMLKWFFSRKSEPDFEQWIKDNYFDGMFV